MNIFKKGDNKEKKKDKSKKKGRPTCKKDADEEKKKRYTNSKARFIGMQLEKLENMYIVLTAEDGMSNP